MKLTNQLISDMRALRTALTVTYHDELVAGIDAGSIGKLAKEIIATETELKILKLRLGLHTRSDW